METRGPIRVGEAETFHDTLRSASAVHRERDTAAHVLSLWKPLLPVSGSELQGNECAQSRAVVWKWRTISPLTFIPGLGRKEDQAYDFPADINRSLPTSCKPKCPGLRVIGLSQPRLRAKGRPRYPG